MNKNHLSIRRLPVLLALLLLCGCGENYPVEQRARIDDIRAEAAPVENEWRYYLGDKSSSQHSPLGQVNKSNVSQLEVAWTYESGGAGDFDTTMPTNPLVVKGIFYGLSADKDVFALDALSGEQLWVRPFNEPAAGLGTGRGLVYWNGTNSTGDAVEWLIVGLGHELYAVDAITGAAIDNFGGDGSIDLRVGLDRPIDGLTVTVSSIGTVYKDLLIQGFGGSEVYGAAPGYLRAYHIPSGEIRWTFRTIPAAGELGADTWPTENREQFGGASSWAGVTVDEQRGIVFVPTSSASYDFYGSDRAGDNLFANSLLALDAQTGERIWHYQIIRHDLWDRDLPSPPNLIEVRKGGERIPAVSQATKSGHLFVFNRETGEPLFPIEEVPVTGTGVPGEYLPASQPVPTLPPPFASQEFELTDISPQSAEYVRAQIQGMTINQPFRAPDEKGLVLYPGMDGGAEWGGQAYDADTGLLYVNASDVPWHFTMEPMRDDPKEIWTLETAYLHVCGGCHGADRQGLGQIFPSLQNIGDKYWPWEVYNLLRDGRGRMPAFANEPWYMLLGPIVYLYTAGDDTVATSDSKGPVTGYRADGYIKLRDEYDLPGSKPPWGTLAAIDVSKGEIAWQIPLGDYPQALAKGLSGLGAENYGGPVVTAGGLVFIAATPDRMIRAFDKQTGALLWQDELPAAGFATPSVYQADGRQFIVVAAGGGKLKQPSGSTYVTYALPE